MEEINQNLSDTSHAAREVMLNKIRSLSESEKLKKVSDLYQAGLAVITAEILKVKPEITNNQLRRELAIRVYGEEFVEKHSTAFRVE